MNALESFSRAVDALNRVIGAPPPTQQEPDAVQMLMESLRGNR